MRFFTLASAAIFALAPFAAAFGDSPADDLLRAVKKARVIDLSHTWDENSPIASVNPHYTFALDATHANTRGAFGDGGQLSFTSEVMRWSGQHGAPSIDAIGHIGRDGRLFGGADAAASTSDTRGIGRDTESTGANLAIDRFPTGLLVNRGVLLDVATMVQKDMHSSDLSRPLPADFEITAMHLEKAAKRQGVRLRPGDTVFIRTGWGQHFSGDPVLYAGGSSPGPGMDAARYLVKHGARIVGNDTLTFEKRPPIVLEPKFQVFPVHMFLIPDHGVYIIENLNLEPLAQKKIYEFVVVVPPLKMRGGTGSAVRIFALAPKDD